MGLLVLLTGYVCHVVKVVAVAAAELEGVLATCNDIDRVGGACSVGRLDIVDLLSSSESREGRCGDDGLRDELHLEKRYVFS